MKKSLKVILFTIVFFVLFLCVFSINVYASGIDDGAYVLKAYDELDLREYIDHSKENNYELFFVTVDVVDKSNPGDYAKQYFDSHAKLNDGVVVLYEKEISQITFITFGRFQQVISSQQARNYSNILTHSLTYDNCYNAFDTAGSYIRLDFSSSDIDFSKINNTNFSLTRILVPTITSVIIGLLVTAIVVAVLIIQHNSACKKVAAQIYLDNTFEVEERRDRFIGERTEVIRGYYNRNNRK
jgi:uncharacterized membrane protein YgcG